MAGHPDSLQRSLGASFSIRALLLCPGCGFFSATALESLLEMIHKASGERSRFNCLAVRLLFSIPLQGETEHVVYIQPHIVQYLEVFDQLESARVGDDVVSPAGS